MSLALSHPPFEMGTYRTLFTMERKISDFTALENLSWVFLCVHEVPALRGFQSDRGWRTVLSGWLSAWLSAPRTRPSRTSGQSVLQRRRAVWDVAPSSGERRSEEFRFCTGKQKKGVMNSDFLLTSANPVILAHSWIYQAPLIHVPISTFLKNQEGRAVWPEGVNEISLGIEVKMTGKELLDWNKIYMDGYRSNLSQFWD